MSEREAFLAGMIYAAGALRAREILNDPVNAADIEAMLAGAKENANFHRSILGGGLNVELTPGEERMRQHGIAIVR